MDCNGQVRYVLFRKNIKALSKFRNLNPRNLGMANVCCLFLLVLTSVRVRSEGGCDQRVCADVPLSRAVSHVLPCP